jgi:hypothetical protein
VIEDQRIDIVDLLRDRGRAGAEFPIVGDPVHRNRRRVRQGPAQRQAVLGRRIGAADHDGLAALEMIAGQRERAQLLVDHEIVGQPQAFDVVGGVLEGIEESLVAMHADLRRFGAQQLDDVGHGLADLGLFAGGTAGRRVRAGLVFGRLLGVAEAEERTQGPARLAGTGRGQFYVGGFHSP